MNDSNVSPSESRQETSPLWLRTQQRLQRMEAWSRRHVNSSHGWDERCLAMEARVHAAGQYLVALLRERERRGLP